ncbi:STAS domain-containing protein [Sphingomonas sp. MMS24-JH45]
MTAAADFTVENDVLRFSGDLSLARLGNLPDRLAQHGQSVRTIDLSAVDRIDTIGAWVVHRYSREHKATIEGLSGDAQHLLEQVEAADQPVRMRPSPPPPSAACWHRHGDRDGGAHLARPARLHGRDDDRVLERDPPSQPLPLQRDGAAVRGGRRQRAWHYRVDELPDRRRHRTAGRGTAAPVRGGGVRGSTWSAASPCASWAC